MCCDFRGLEIPCCSSLSNLVVFVSMATIQARKNQKGENRYFVQVRLKGYPPQRATFSRKTDARKWAAQTESAIREGRHFKTAEAKKHTLADLIDRYIRDVVPSRPKSNKKRTAQLSEWRTRIGHYTLANVTPMLIAEQRNVMLNETTRRGKPRSNATVVRYLSALSHAFSVAVKEWGWVEENPVFKVTKPKEPRGRVRFLSDDERTRLLLACQESENPVLYIVVVLALSTGMRQGEILNLRWENVDLKRGRIVLHDTKNEERRVVPVTGHALELMKRHMKVRRLDSDLVFPSRNGQTPVYIHHSWLVALKRAGIKDFRFHDTRHSAASYLAMNGASLAEIAEVLGHKTLQMVKRYAHLSEAHTAGVVARMNERIFGP